MFRDIIKYLRHINRMNEQKQKEAWAAILAEVERRIADRPRGAASRVAEALGMDRGMLSKWRSGEIRGERKGYDEIVAIMKRLNLDYTAFFGAPVAGGSPTVVPLINLAQSGQDYWQKDGGPPGAAAPAPPGGGYPGMFAVRACDDSLAPEGIRAGFIVYCEGAAKPVPGDVIFVERTGGAMSLKRLRGEEGGWYVLEGWMPADDKGQRMAYTIPQEKKSLTRACPVLFVRRR